MVVVGDDDGPSRHDVIVLQRCSHRASHVHAADRHAAEHVRQEVAFAQPARPRNVSTSLTCTEAVPVSVTL